MDLENVIHREVRKTKQYRLVMHIHGILKKNGIIYTPLDDPICKAGIETHRENCVYTNREGVVVGRIGKLGLIHIQYCSVQFSCSVMSNSLWPHGLQHAWLPCPSPTLRATQTHVHHVGDVIQSSHPLSSLSLPTFHLSQHQGLFQWVSSSHQVTKVLELQLQHQSFQWIFRSDFL